MILRRPLLISAVLALTVSLYSGNAIAGDAEDFIRSAGEKAFTSLSNELPEEKRADRFREILLETFDLRVIARFTLGRYWRRRRPSAHGDPANPRSSCNPQWRYLTRHLDDHFNLNRHQGRQAPHTHCRSGMTA